LGFNTVTVTRVKANRTR